jgi:hypothetical protein
MRGIRIWHLAVLGLSVPLLMAAVPPACTGGLNPTFRGAIGQDAGTGLPEPPGYHVVGIFDQTGFPGWLNVGVVGAAFNMGWRLDFAALTPDANTWACNLTSITPTGGTLLVPDATGAIQQVGIVYNGGALTFGQQLACGTLVKLSVVPITVNGNLFAIWPPGSTVRNVPGLTYHIFVDIISH